LSSRRSEGRSLDAKSDAAQEARRGDTFVSDSMTIGSLLSTAIGIGVTVQLDVYDESSPAALAWSSS